MLATKPMNGASTTTQPEPLTGLQPTPAEEWDRLRHFLNITGADIEAMLTTVEVLFRRGHELVVETYDYLLSHHDTAVILGWEKGADEAHLAERRRFFTIWLARTLGLDMGHDFARYLFRAGQVHAAHGPREIYVPERYVTGSISLVHATFARFLTEEMPDAPQVAAALAGWNKILNLHLHMMLQGFQSAREWDEGEQEITLSLFGKMRKLAHSDARTISLSGESSMRQVLTRFFNYYPHIREEVFTVEWQQGERIDEKGTPWMTVAPAYRIRDGWRVLRNGRNIIYLQGLDTPIADGDAISFFPPGR